MLYNFDRCLKRFDRLGLVISSQSLGICSTAWLVALVIRSRGNPKFAAKSRYGRLDEFHSRLSDRPPDQSAWSDRVAAIERHLELTRQVDRIRDLEARAFVGQIAHDTIDDR